MDVTPWLLRHTPPRPFLGAVPGAPLTRFEVEKQVRHRGWRWATSPAEANILVVAGAPNTDLARCLDRVWAQLPAPRVWVRLGDGDPHVVARALDAAVTTLHDPDEQRRQAVHAAGPADDSEDVAATESGQGAADEHSGHDDSGHDSGHGAHGSEGMDPPGGIPMAGRDEDRDGLMLDVLHLPLGPVLPEWPPGLVIRAVIQGDVISDSSVEVVGASEPLGRTRWADAPRVRALDSCARLLAVAGWDDAALTARGLRDDLLHPAADGPRPGFTRRISAWARRVRRSRTLRWSLAGIGNPPSGVTPPEHLRGDTLDRLHRRVETAEHGAGPLSSPDTGRWVLDALPAFLDGAELGVARLIVAGLDPDTDHLAVRAGAHHD